MNETLSFRPNENKTNLRRPSRLDVEVVAAAAADWDDGGGGGGGGGGAVAMEKSARWGNGRKTW